MQYQVRQRKSAPSRGQGIVEYVLIAALLSMVVLGGLALTGTSVGDAYQRVVDFFGGEDITGGGAIPQATLTPTPLPADLTVTVRTSTGQAVSAVTVWAFNGAGSEIAAASTNAEGVVVFSGLTPDRYKFRADYNGQAFWSGTIAYPNQTSASITITVREISVQVVNARGLKLADVAVHAFTANDNYTGSSQTTDQNGTAVFTLPDGSYKFRADYKSQPYWSEVITTTSTTSVQIRIPEAPFTVRVSNRQGQAVSDVPVYAFNADEAYTGITGRTGDDGTVVLDLPNGTYKFRADYDGQAYWSEQVTSPESDATTIQVGGTQVTVRVVAAAGGGLAERRVYVYRDENYTGQSAVTDARGNVVFELDDGEYRFRTDDRGKTYWSENIRVPQTNQATITVSSGVVRVRVTDQRGNAFSDIYIFVFRLVRYGHSIYYYYSGQYGVTDSNGEVVLTLEPDRYRILAYNYNYRNYNYRFRYQWSDVIYVPPTTSVSLRIFR